MGSSEKGLLNAVTYIGEREFCGGNWKVIRGNCLNGGLRLGYSKQAQVRASREKFPEKIYFIIAFLSLKKLVYSNQNVDCMAVEYDVVC
jgi:hypothetical protein